VPRTRREVGDEVSGSPLSREQLEALSIETGARIALPIDQKARADAAEERAEALRAVLARIAAINAHPPIMRADAACDLAIFTARDALADDAARGKT